ncbi:MAG TPA: 16S rRNA (adenine(1518)-N(6)/adenine(1519)-N(6))-dimethyltransferase RsmA [Candidatus Saccharimonadales bacterium]
MLELPNKSLGQHWLQDEKTLQAIIDFSGVEVDDFVLEIGPGLGTLTAALINSGVKVYAVEYDKQLAAQLPSRVQSPHLEVEQADILQFNLAKLPAGYKAVANVPYYITSAIVRRLLESTNPPQSATLLVQKEVAERIAAQPGAMSLLSVAARFYANVSLGPVVPARLFTPPPKVDSQVVRLDYSGPKFRDIDTKTFFRVVKVGFAERRKKLRSSLSGGLHMPKPEIDNVLKQAKIAPEARPQELSLEQWHALAKALGV